MLATSRTGRCAALVFARIERADDEIVILDRQRKRLNVNDVALNGRRLGMAESLAGLVLFAVSWLGTMLANQGL